MKKILRSFIKILKKMAQKSLIFAPSTLGPQNDPFFDPPGTPPADPPGRPPPSPGPGPPNSH